LNFEGDNLKARAKATINMKRPRESTDKDLPMKKVRKDLLGLIDNANDLQEIKSMLKVAKERFESRKEKLRRTLKSMNVRREMAQMAQATFSEDQKFINTIWITDFKVFDAKQAHDDNCNHCFTRCENCDNYYSNVDYEECDTTMSESHDAEQKLHFWFGFSADDIKNAIPDYFEDCRGLIAEFACSRIKIEIENNDENNSISFKNEAQTILLHHPNRYVRVTKDEDYAGYDIVTMQILESFPIFSMIIDLRQMIFDIGFGDYFKWGVNFQSDFARCFPSICWNWQSRFLGLENQECLNRWPLQTVKEVVDALKGRNDTMFGPCNGSGSALDHVKKFVLEESNIWETKVMTIDAWRRKHVLDKETGLVKRDEVDGFIQGISKQKKQFRWE